MLIINKYVYQTIFLHFQLLNPNIDYSPHEACVARGSGDDDLRLETNKLAKAIADYKVASKTIKGLESQAKPKVPKAKAKSQAKAEAAPVP